jgi:hypothetical protein
MNHCANQRVSEGKSYSIVMLHDKGEDQTEEKGKKWKIHKGIEKNMGKGENE